MTSKLTIILLAALLSFGCKRGHVQEHAHGSANEYMHRSSTQSLIRNFEKPERAGYQEPYKVVEYIGVTGDMTVMDLGAGSGYFTFPLAETGARVIAADVNDEFQEYIRQKIKYEDAQKLQIELRKIPFDSPLLEPNEVDKILMVNTYHHIEDRVAYFKNALSGIKEGGELVVVDYFKKNLPVGPPSGHKISRDVVVKELKEAGYTDVSVDTDLLKYQYVVRAGKL